MADVTIACVTQRNKIIISSQFFKQSRVKITCDQVLTGSDELFVLRCIRISKTSLKQCLFFQA